MNNPFSEVTNMDDIVRSLNPNYTPTDTNNAPLMPQHKGFEGPPRVIITGASGIGKTNSILGAITARQIKADHIWLCTGSPNQMKYKTFMKIMNTLQKQMSEQIGEEYSLYTLITEPEQLPEMEELDTSISHLCLIDDMVSKKNQQWFEDAFIKARNFNMGLIYITQDFYKVSPIIRRNCNYFMIFKPNSKTDVDLLTAEHSLVHKEHFKEIFNKATEDKHSFLFLDKRTDIPLLRIRKNFNQVWVDEENDFVPIQKLLQNNPDILQEK